MNVETLISEMNRGDLLDAMELIWGKLSAEPNELDSPDWHLEVIEERLQNPPNLPLCLEESKSEIKDRLNARRTQGLKLETTFSKQRRFTKLSAEEWVMSSLNQFLEIS